jgi:hypothetical protein
MALLPSMLISLMLGRSATTTTSTLPSRPMRMSSKLPVAKRLRADWRMRPVSARHPTPMGMAANTRAGGDPLQALDPDVRDHEPLGPGQRGQEPQGKEPVAASQLSRFQGVSNNQQSAPAAPAARGAGAASR